MSTFMLIKAYNNNNNNYYYYYYYAADNDVLRRDEMSSDWYLSAILGSVWSWILLFSGSSAHRSRCRLLKIEVTL